MQFDIQCVSVLLAIEGHEQFATASAFTFGSGFFGSLLAIHGQPTGFLQHLAVGLEAILANAGEACRHLELRRREEHRDEAARDHIEELLLGLAHLLGRDDAGRDDSKVITHLAAVEHTSIRAHPVVAQRLARMRDQVLRHRIMLGGRMLREGLHRADHGAQIVIRQESGIGSRIRQHLELLIQRLGDLQCAAGAEAKAVAGLTLQAGQVIEQGHRLTRRLRDFSDRAKLANAASDDGFRLRLVPNSLGFFVLVVLVFLMLLIEPAAMVTAALNAKQSMHFKIGAWHKGGDGILALGEDG